jgi:hypothetical protein
MITLKITALIVGAGLLGLFLLPDFAPDLVIAVLACFS